MSNEIPLLMPKMSMTMTEGDMSRWIKQVGDTVKAGEVVCEVMTDKVDMEVESPVDGVLARIVANEGDTVPVGEPMAFITSDADDLLGDLLAPSGPSAGTSTTTPAPAEVPTPISPTSTATPSAVPTPVGPVAAVPRARARAREAGLDLAPIHGTGPNGLITVADVERALAASIPAAPAVAPTVAGPAPNTSVATPQSTPVTTSAHHEPVDPKRKAAVRERVAAVMTTSAAIPQFTIYRDLDLEPLAAVRGPVSWNTLLLRALARTLRMNPMLNGTYGPQGFTPAEHVGVAVAVDTAVGLLAPTVTDADLIDVEALDVEMRALIARARTGKLDAKYLAPASTALSNLGGMGVERFNAMLTPPQVSALSVGSITRRPMAHHGGIALRISCTVGLTVDHRALDGADAARALAALADLVANPATLL